MESLLETEAQQNVSRLENGRHSETMELVEGANFMTVWKRGWVDKLMGKKVRRTRKDTHVDKDRDKDAKNDEDKEHQPPSKYGDLRDLVIGVNALEKFEVKKKEKLESSQGILIKRLSGDLCGAISDQGYCLEPHEIICNVS
ncbi:unnamed protein product [Calypogeia fissa]